MSRILLCTALLVVPAHTVSAFSNFNREQLTLLQDPSGWDYVKMSYDGMQTDHPCFDGNPHPGTCSGRLILFSNNQFRQEVTIQGQLVPRHGTYSLAGNQLTFFDELETRDGPYTVELNGQNDSLLMSMRAVRVELALHRKPERLKRPHAPGALFLLTPDQLKMLQDPAGWDYIKMEDSGIQTEHTCFDGKPHPEICSGRLILTPDNKFIQDVTIQGQPVPRRGSYTLEEDQLTFFDELETRDGPYTIEVDPQKKSLLMYTSAVRIELTLHKTLRDKKRKEAK